MILEIVSGVMGCLFCSTFGCLLYKTCDCNSEQQKEEEEKFEPSAPEYSICDTCSEPIIQFPANFPCGHIHHVTCLKMKYRNEYLCNKCVTEH